MRAAHGGGAQTTKDSEGRNIKRHFVTWKYYVKKVLAGQKPEKEKFYITADCEKILENAKAVCAKEGKLKYKDLM